MCVYVRVHTKGECVKILMKDGTYGGRLPGAIAHKYVRREPTLLATHAPEQPFARFSVYNYGEPAESSCEVCCSNRPLFLPLLSFHRPRLYSSRILGTGGGPGGWRHQFLRIRHSTRQPARRLTWGTALRPPTSSRRGKLAF